MEDHSGMVVLVAAACVILGMFMVAWRRASPGAQPRLVYFYDIQTGGTYPGPVDDLPPTRAPSGGVGVRAIILSCGQCEPEDDNYTGWIERYTEGLKEVYRQFGVESDKIPLSIHESGREIARPGIQPRWHRLRSDEGQAIRREALMRCGGKPPVICLP